MKRILASLGEGIKKGVEDVIDACVNKSIKFVEWLKRVRDDILSKLLIKLSSHCLKGYSQQLIGIEEKIKEMNDLLPSEGEIQRIADLAKTVGTIPKKDLSDISDFITDFSKDIAKITTLAVATKEFTERDAKSISKFIKKLSKVELQKAEILVETKRTIRGKNAKKIPNDEKNNLEKIIALTNTDALNKIEKTVAAEVLDHVLTSLSNIPPSKKDAFRDELEYLKLTLGVGELLPDFDRLEFDHEKQAERLKKARNAHILEELKIKDVTEQWKGIDELRISIGIMLLKDGEYESAYKSFDNITKINPELKKVWLNKGIAAGGMRDYKEEINCYDKALEIDGNYALALYNKGILLKEANMHAQAEQNLKKACEIDPKLCKQKGVFH